MGQICQRESRQGLAMLPRLFLNPWRQVILLPQPPKVLGLQATAAEKPKLHLLAESEIDK
ncbi:hexokinase 1, partial [Homo sapiens]